MNKVSSNVKRKKKLFGTKIFWLNEEFFPLYQILKND